MKTKALLITATGLLLTSAALVLVPSAPAVVQSRNPLNSRAPLPRVENHTPFARGEDTQPTADLTAKRQRFEALPETDDVRDDAAAADALAAETLYAEAAPDPASRLALLWLDRERDVRAEAAHALADPTEQSQAMAELESWYEDGRGAIVASNEIE